MFVALLMCYLFIEPRTRLAFYFQPKTESLHILPDKNIAPVLSMGFQNIWADFILLKSQLHVHDTSKQGLIKDGKLLKEMMELILKLDPYYVDGFIFGSFALSEFWDNLGVADSIDLLEKAWHWNKDEHRFPMYIGFNYSMKSENKKEAIKWFRLALRDEDAPQNLVWVVDALMGQDDLNSTIQRDAVCNICDEAKDKTQKREYCLRCKFYVLLVELNEGSKLFAKQQGRPMKHISEFVKFGYLDQLPKEPLGGNWYVNEKGIITSTTTNRAEQKATR